jgi:glycosyltransferase involved in cell wall biosynthesis
MNEKTVAIISSNAYEPDIRIYLEATSLVKNGYRVQIIAWDRQHRHTSFENHHHLAVLRCHYDGQYGKGISSLLNFIFYYYFVFSSLLKLRVDIINSHDLDMLPAGFFLSKIKKTKFVYDPHENEYFGRFPKPIRKFFVSIEKHLSKNADAILVTNGLHVEKFKKFIKTDSKIVEIRNCPDNRFFDNPHFFKKDEKSLILGWIGYIQPNAGIERLLWAYSDLGRQYQNLEILFVGKIHPNFQNSFQSIIQKINNKNIRIVPPVKYPEVVKYYDIIDIAFMLYENVPQYRRNTPMKLYEAMAKGIPVIATPIGDVKAIVEKSHCGLMVDFNDNKDLIEKLILLIESKKLRKTMGHNGHLTAMNKFRWDQVEKTLIKTYKQLHSNKLT